MQTNTRFLISGLVLPLMEWQTNYNEGASKCIPTSGHITLMFFQSILNRWYIRLNSWILFSVWMSNVNWFEIGSGQYSLGLDHFILIFHFRNDVQKFFHMKQIVWPIYHIHYLNNIITSPYIVFNNNEYGCFYYLANSCYRKCFISYILLVWFAFDGKFHIC